MYVETEDAQAGNGTEEVQWFETGSVLCNSLIECYWYVQQAFVSEGYYKQGSLGWLYARAQRRCHWQGTVCSVYFNQMRH